MSYFALFQEQSESIMVNQLSITDKLRHVGVSRNLG